MNFKRLATIALAGLALTTEPDAAASDHNEPAADPVWRADQALHKEWDISDLFAWYDGNEDRFNVIVAWHPQQLPLSEGQRTEYNDQVLYTIHFRYERSGVHVLSDRWFDRTITFRYGQNDEGKWGILIDGVPGSKPIVDSCESPDQGFRAFQVEASGSDDPIDIATGSFDDPFVFDLDGYNASLTRALNGEVGLKFDPNNDTFEGHNVTAFVISIPTTAMEGDWKDFELGQSLSNGFQQTSEIHVWATTKITDSEVDREGGR